VEVSTSVLHSDHLAELAAFQVAMVSLQLQDIQNSSSSSSSSRSSDSGAANTTRPQQQQQQQATPSHSVLLPALNVQYSEDVLLKQCSEAPFMGVGSFRKRKLTDLFNNSVGVLKAMLIEHTACSSSSTLPGDGIASTAAQIPPFWRNGVPVWLPLLVLTSIEVAAGWPGGHIDVQLTCIDLVNSAIAWNQRNEQAGGLAASFTELLLPPLLHRLGPAALQLLQDAAPQAPKGSKQQQQQQADSDEDNKEQQERAASLWEEYCELLESLPLLGEAPLTA
jgi:hypothetical protein